MTQYQGDRGTRRFTTKSDVLRIDRECIVVGQDMGDGGQSVEDSNWKRIFGYQTILYVDDAARNAGADVVAYVC